MSHNKEKEEKVHVYPDGRNKLLIKELAELWFKDIEKIMKPSSCARYRSHAVKYLFPYIGDMDAGSFSKKDLSDVLGFLKAGGSTEEPLSQYTVYILEGMVRSMFRYGAGKNFVSEVLFGKSEYTITNKKEAVPLSELELGQLMNVVSKQGMDLQVQVLLPLYAGLSLSEICGLKWEDVNLETGRIHVHRNLMRIQRKTGNTDNNTATVMSECELSVNECREFVMPGKLNILLKTVADKRNISKERYVAELYKKTGKRTLGVNIQESSNPVPPDGRTLQYRLKAVGRQADVPELTFQGLRDTFVVMCLQAGGDIYSIAYVLGINVAAVCDRYEAWFVKKESFLSGIG
jgi:integrase